MVAVVHVAMVAQWQLPQSEKVLPIRPRPFASLDGYKKGLKDMANPYPVDFYQFLKSLMDQALTKVGDNQAHSPLASFNIDVAQTRN